jgi:sugar lactone lactonase YvrE/predicted esterase
MKSLALLLLAASAALAGSADYPLGPDSQVQANVPHGTITKHVLPPGRLYPGTPHQYAVYVPAQYNAAQPTPFMIFLDGSGFLSDKERAPTVFDNLIAKHELPPMIAIFIDPGVLPALSDNAQNRYERVFEYDSISDRFSRFLLEELIPAVAKSYHLSPNPDDRGLCGVSTGAVGAFMAAWHRPDQFHRVLSFIGTYVAMKGADTLPALVRKTEPKPIRIFMQDGKNDHVVPAEPYGTFYAGSWPINNQVMYEALEYAGYDAKLVMGEEAHNMKQGAAILPDALRWLWRGYPQGIVVHEPPGMHQPGWDPRAKVYSLVNLNQPWEQVGKDYHSVAGPASSKDGDVLFAEPLANRIYRVDKASNVTVSSDRANGVAALAVGPDGKLYAAEPAQHRIVSFGIGGDQKVVARSVEANALAITSHNTLYFADQQSRTVGYVDTNGKVHVVYRGGEIGQPSALALSPDEAMLVVADAEGRFSWSFQIARDGSLMNGEPYYRLEMPEQFNHPDWLSGISGVTEDGNGTVYFATPLGIQVCEANGRLAAILNPPEYGTINNLVFGGKDRDWLYVTEDGKLFRRHTRVRGVASGSPEKPPKPSL